MSFYRVAFESQPVCGDPSRDFYFHSLAAIYDTFTDRQIGCKLSRLYNIGVSDGNAYRGRLCTITREPIMRKKRISRASGVEKSESE